MATEHEALAPVRISFIALFQRNIYQASAAYNIWLAFSVSFSLQSVLFQEKNILFCISHLFSEGSKYFNYWLFMV